MVKRLITICIILVSLLLLPVVSFAAPETFEQDAKGTAEGLIEIANFTGEEIKTHEKTHSLSGSGEEGVIVTLYVYSEGVGYKKVRIKKSSENEEVSVEFIDIGADTTQKLDTQGTQVELQNAEELSWEIGPTGRFMQEIQLDQGTNKFALYAEKDQDTYEIIKIDITLLKKDILEKLKDIDVDIIKMQLENIIPKTGMQ